MKKSLLILIFIGLFSMNLCAQYNVPDSKNRSSLFNQPSSIGLDLTSGKLNLEFNNIISQHTNENKWLAGIKYSGGLDNGTSNVFKDGDYVFGNELKGFFGYSCMINSKEIKQWDDTLSIILKKIQEDETSFGKKIKEKIEKFYRDNDIKENDLRWTMVQTWIFGSSDPVHASKLPKKRLALTSQMVEGLDKVFVSEVNNMFKVLNSLMDEYDCSEINMIKKKSETDQKLIELNKKKWHSFRITFFMAGGLNGHKFQFAQTGGGYIHVPDSIEFNGGDIGFGANILCNSKHYFGLLYNFEWTDNLADLKKTDYTVSGTDYTAYIGSYNKFSRHILGFDNVYYLKFKDLSSVAVNVPYLRYSTWKSLAGRINTTDIGISADFFKPGGKFLFGLYTELEDVFNKNSTGKNFIDHINFGVRVNYALFTNLNKN